jgi:hypothetical protein
VPISPDEAEVWSPTAIKECQGIPSQGSDLQLYGTPPSSTSK